MGKQFSVLAIAVITVLFAVVGCSANPRQSRQMIVGRWVLAVESSQWPAPVVAAVRMEFLADGTGLAEYPNEAMSFQWRIDDDNRIIKTAKGGLVTRILTIREVSRTVLIVSERDHRFTYKTSQEHERLTREREREQAREQERERVREQEREKARSNIQRGNFTDSRDRQTYRTVKIGNLTWMAQNLNFQTENSWCYDNNSANCEKYGRLYTWNAAMNACPAGWRLPNDEDWNALVSAVGSNAGTKLKSQTGWNTGSGHIPGTDEFGFSALPGGYRRTDGSFNDVGHWGFWWSATELDASSARNRHMGWRRDGVYSGWDGKSGGISLRCVRDERP